MSWDLDLVADVDGHEIKVWDSNYTHNCNPMIKAAANNLTGLNKDFSLYDLAGPASSAVIILGQLLLELRWWPDKYRAMNPQNGWGDYEGLMEWLKSLKDVSLEYPSCKWKVNG